MYGSGFLGPEFDFLAAWPPTGAREPSPEARLRALVEPSRSLCIIATTRNEGAYILDWIAYHIEIGVEAFFIYSNDDDDGSDVLLRALANSGIISYRQNDGRGCAPQYKAYSHALKAVPEVLDYEWALILDVDEYLVVESGRFSQAQSFLASMDADVVSMNWHMFGVFGQERADLHRPLIERFTLRFPDVNPHTKSAFRPRFCDHSHAHYPFGSGVRSLRRLDAAGSEHVAWPGEPSLSQSPLEGGAWVNHYWTKSLDELYLKFSSNTGDQSVNINRSPMETEQKVRDYLNDEDRQSPIDDRRAQRLLPFAQKRLKSLLALPGVQSAYSNVLAERRARLISAHRRV